MLNLYYIATLNYSIYFPVPEIDFPYESKAHSNKIETT